MITVIVIEFLTMLIFLIIFVRIFWKFLKNDTVFDFCIIGIIMFGLAFQYGVSLLKLVFTVKSLIEKYRERKSKNNQNDEK
jgi:uncharacterized membrane protein